MTSQSDSPNQKEDVLEKQAWELAWLEKKPRKAISLLRELLLLDRNRSSAQLEIAKIAYHLLPDRIDLASAAIESFLSQASESSDGHYYRGLIESRLGNSKESEISHRSAIRLDPYDVRPQVAVAQLLMDSDEFNEGLSLLEQAAELASVGHSYSEPATRSILANAYKRAGRFEESAEQWKVIAKLRALWPVDEKFAEAVEAGLKDSSC